MWHHTLERRQFLKTSLQGAAVGLASSNLILPAQGFASEAPNRRDFSSELPKMVIALNVKTFGTLVPQGLAALLAQYPHLSLPVEASKPLPPAQAQARFGSFPGAAGLIKLQTDSAVAKIQAHLFRPRLVKLYREGRAYPVRADGSFYEIRYWSYRVEASVLSGSPEELWFAVRGGYLSPASLRGDALLVHEFIPQAHSVSATEGHKGSSGHGSHASSMEDSIRRRQAWIYQSGSRRVRRAPDLAYDAVSDGSEGMITADQVDGFNGAMDRYDWVDLGEAERLIAYNMLEGSKARGSADDLLGRGSLKGSAFRLERHRVHEVEARLRPGQRHIYARRTFLIDVATQTIVMEEAFDTRGGLWRVALHGLAFNEVLGCAQTRVSVYHDLLSGGYFVTGLDPESGPVFETHRTARWIDFQPDALRRQGR
ncbi:MAG: DUF1329 domain-containing protein [Bordetella sp.]